jgi:hypothetical protein
MIEGPDGPLLEARLLREVSGVKALRRRMRHPQKGVEDDLPKARVGDVWTVQDSKVHFRGERQEARTWHDRRPGAITVAEPDGKQVEVCWVPGSSKCDGRDPRTTVVYSGTCFLLQFHEWYTASTLLDRRGRLPAEKIEELVRKFRDLRGGGDGEG